VRNRTVLFGGNDGGSDLGDTWEWDGTNWLRRTTVVAPPPRRRHALAFDPSRGCAVLFGGNFADTWEWNGTLWRQRTPASSPQAVSWNGLACDTARGRITLAGGIFFDGTWEYVVPFDTVGPGSVVGSIPLTCTADPTRAASFCLQFATPIGLGFMALALEPCTLPPTPIVDPALCSPLLYYFVPCCSPRQGNPLPCAWRFRTRRPWWAPRSARRGSPSKRASACARRTPSHFASSRRGERRRRGARARAVGRTPPLLPATSGGT
jgi:hypothetical protein